MLFDVAVIALSLAAIAYVVRSMSLSRTAVADGMPSHRSRTDTTDPGGSMSLGLLRSALSMGHRAKMAQAMTGHVADTSAPEPLLTAESLAATMTPDQDGAATRPDAALVAKAEEPADTADFVAPDATDLLASLPSGPQSMSADAAATGDPLDMLIDIGGPASHVEVVDLSDPEDVLALEFAEDPTGHLHLLHGRASAEVGNALTRTAWLDVYLSRSDWLDRHDLDPAGEFSETLATHVLRIDLGRTMTAPDGTVSGGINEDPDLYFDRDIASEIEFND